MTTFAPTPVEVHTEAPHVEPPVKTKLVKWHGERADATSYIFLLPAVILFTLFITLPALIGMIYSVTDYVGFGDSKFIGLANFQALFSDPRILSAYAFTIGFSLISVVLVNIIALALAIGLNSKIAWKSGLRGVFFIPMVISGIVIAYVFNFLFSNSLPTLATSLNIPFLQSSILANENLAWIAIVIVTVWQSVPGMMIVYLAGLLSIPGEVYEAGSLDGATKWRSFTSITLPLMVGYVVINTVLGFKNFLNAYDIIVGLTNGGPGTATRSIPMTIVTGFTGGDYAYQMANAVVFFIVTVVVSLLQLRLIKGREMSL